MRDGIMYMRMLITEWEISLMQEKMPDRRLIWNRAIRNILTSFPSWRMAEHGIRTWEMPMIQAADAQVRAV